MNAAGDEEDAEANSVHVEEDSDVPSIGKINYQDASCDEQPHKVQGVIVEQVTERFHRQLDK